MRNILLVLSFLILSFHFTQSQSFSWLDTVVVDYEYNPGMIQYNTCANPQGGCYFYGIQEHISFYNESMGVLFLKKYSQDGTENWSRLIGGESEIKGMICADNGDVFISGQILADADFWGEDSLVKTGIGTDGFLARVNTNGDLNWCINLTGLSVGEGTVSELALHNNLLYVAYSNWMNTYVLIFTEDGEYVNSIIQEDVSIISGLDFDQEGNLFTTGGCAGWQASFGGVSYPAPFSYTTYLVKYNSSFEPEWVKYIEDITCTFPQVKVDEDGWAYFAGQLWDETLFDTIVANGPEWAYDFFLARISPDGQFQWVRECPEVLTGDASIGNRHFLDMDMDGNVLMAGFTRGLVDWGNGVVSDVTDNYQDLIIWNFAPDGQVNWIKTAGGEGYELSHSVSAGSDGSAYLAGVVSGVVEFDTITFETTGLVDPFVAKLNLDILSGVTPILSGNEMIVYPNPATDRIYLDGIKAATIFKLFNINGQLVYTGTISASENYISLQGFPGGNYLLNLDSRGERNSFQIIIE